MVARGIRRRDRADRLGADHELVPGDGEVFLGGAAAVRLWLRAGPPGVALLVWDAIAAPPLPRAAGPDDESGRGLAIVADLSTACGNYPAADPPGKVTWALITIP